MGREQALVAIKHATYVQAQCLIGHDTTAIAIVELAAAQAQAGFARQFAAAVVDLIDRERQPLRRPQQSAQAIVQAGAGQAQRPLGDQLATLVVEAGNRPVDIGLAGNPPQAVIEAGGIQQHRTIANHEATLVDHRGIGGQPEAAITADQTMAVVQATAMAIDPVGGDLAIEVAQRLGNAQGQGLVADQFALAVVQARGGQGKGLGAGDFATLVVHALKVFQHQQRCVNQAALVVQLTLVEVQAQGGLAAEASALLVETTDAGGQGAVAGNPAGIAVADLARGQVERCVTGQLAAQTVVQGTGADTAGPLAADHPGQAVVQALAGQRQAIATGNRATLAEHCARAAEHQAKAAGQGTAGVVQAGSADIQMAVAADQSLEVAQGLIQANIQVAVGDYLTVAIVQVLAEQRQAALAGQEALALVDHLPHG